MEKIVSAILTLVLVLWALTFVAKHFGAGILSGMPTFESPSSSGKTNGE